MILSGVLFTVSLRTLTASIGSTVMLALILLLVAWDILRNSGTSDMRKKSLALVAFIFPLLICSIVLLLNRTSITF